MPTTLQKIGRNARKVSKRSGAAASRQAVMTTNSLSNKAVNRVDAVAVQKPVHAAPTPMPRTAMPRPVKQTWKERAGAKLALYRPFVRR